MAIPKTLVIASSEGPPHTMKGVNNGIDLDIIKAVLNRMGYEARFEFMGLKRAQREVMLGRVDAMAPIFSAKDRRHFYISSPIVQYQPMVFSLASRDLSPQVLRDLDGYSLVTFQDAAGYFDDNFLYLTKSRLYQEMADMGVIPELITKGRYDFAVLDSYIFYYFYRLENKLRDTQIFREHHLIQSVTASIGFNDPDLRDAFNRELEAFLHSDGYQKILSQYLGEGIELPVLFQRNPCKAQTLPVYP